MLFVAAKVSHLNLLPQGKAEPDSRSLIDGATQMDAEGFGNCTNQYECSAVCPKEINASYITKLNRDYAKAAAKEMVGAR